MPFTFNGFGTTYYGRRHPAEDGSYVTTLWVTAIYVPLIPLGSYRVRPVGAGTNIIVHRSQSYQVARVPLCWPQVRNVYIWLGPILLLILYFNASDIQQWWKEDVLKSRTPQPAAQYVLKPEPVQTELPLSGKDAAVACGKVLKLDKDVFQKLSIDTRLAQAMDESGFTEHEVKEIGDSPETLQKQAFSGYAFAYLSWDKPEQVSRASFDKMVMDAVNSSSDIKNLTASDRTRVDAYLVKFKRMMLKAFDLGRHDARLSPCPF